RRNRATECSRCPIFQRAFDLVPLPLLFRLQDDVVKVILEEWLVVIQAVRRKVRQVASLSVLTKSVGLIFFTHLLLSTTGAIQRFEDTSDGASKFHIRGL